MSLILDALRKSEAERKRGQMPGLHSAGGRTVRSERRWVPMAGAVAALALIGGGYWMLRAPATAPASTDLAANDSTGAASDAAILTADAAQAGGEPDTLAVAPGGSLAAQPMLERESVVMPATDASLISAGYGGPTGATVQSAAQSSGGEWPAPQLTSPATAGAQPLVDAAPVTPVPASVPEPVASPPVEPAPVEVVVAAPEPAVPPVTAPVAAPPAEATQVTGFNHPISGLENPGAPPVSATSLPAAELPPPADPALPTFYELDYQTRRLLPKMLLTMHVYSTKVDGSFALVNGKRYTPGGEAIEGKVLIVEVVPDGLVCEFQGKRFLLPRQ